MDFQEKLQALQNLLTDNIGTGSDSMIENTHREERHKKKEDPPKIDAVEELTIASIVKIQQPEESSLFLEHSRAIQNLEQRVTILEDESTLYKSRPILPIIQKEEKKETESSESKLFSSMLDIYLYSVIINPELHFTTELYQQYKEKLTIISQNILANSFRFLEKDSILEETIKIGEQIQQEYSNKKEKESLKKIQDTLKEMKQSLLKPSYQKNLYFAKFLNKRGLILNATTIINEILGEYIVASAQNLSTHSKERVQFHLQRISRSQTSRRAYYHFYKSATNFFYNQFSTQTNEMETTFFPYKDTGNKEIELQFRRIFQSNRRNKANLFSLYSEMIYRIRVIRNDLVHGNNQRYYHNISYEIEDVLIDLEYLTIQKNFLGA